MNDTLPIHVIDGGCTTLQGLMDRCDLFKDLHGPGTVTNHSRGFLYQSEDGYRILVTLEGTVQP